MASVKTLIGGVLGRLVFREASATLIQDISPHFRRVELEGQALRGVEWEAGDKVQIFVPEIGMRTYTPLDWDTQKGKTTLLVYLHGASPGAAWARGLRNSERVQLFGPRRSLTLSGHRGAVVLFGDETSFAVAHALRATEPQREVTCIFEVSDRAESSAALGTLGLEGSEIERTAGEAHLSEVYQRLRKALLARENAQLVMTGKAQSIQVLKAQLKTENLGRSAKVKAYWSVGKTGLD